MKDSYAASFKIEKDQPFMFHSSSVDRWLQQFTACFFCEIIRFFEYIRVNASFEIVGVIFIQEAIKTREPLFMEQEAVLHSLMVEPHILPSIAKLFIETL